MTEDTPLSALDDRGGDHSPQTTILVGVDGSDSAGHAAAWAAGEAERRGATLKLVHALHLPEVGSAVRGARDHAEQRRADGRKLLDEQAAATRSGHPGLDVTTELSDLDPARALSTLGESAALIVAGGRGRGGFAGMLLGSVSRKLAVHASRPLVVVRAEPEPEPGPGGQTAQAADAEDAPVAEPATDATDATDATGAEDAEQAADRIVLGVGPKHSGAAIRFAFEAARRQGAVLEVVRAYFANVIYTGMAGVGTMYEGHPESDKIYAVKEARAAIEPLAAEFGDVTVRVSALEGNAVAALIDTARRARLLVVASHRRHGPLPVGAGYVVDGVLAHSPVPVAVIPDR